MASDANGNGNGNGHGINAELNFGSDVFNIIAAAGADNIAISPLLLEALLTLLYLGSDGSTAEELQRVLHVQRFANNTKLVNYYATQLHLATDDKADTRMQLCSRLLLSGANCAAADEFQRIAQKYFHTVAAAQPTASSSAQLRTQLNEWLAQAAVGCAWRCSEELLTASKALEAATAAAEANAASILAAAVRFESKWFLPFSAYRTGIYDFQLAAATDSENGQQSATATTAPCSIPVPMLFDDDMFVKFAEFRELDARAIELPYEHDDELAMLVVLPNQRDGLPALERQLQAQDLGALTERMQMESVQVLLPKFKIDFECSLRQCLEQLGITKVFSKEANFKNLLHENSTTALQFDDILHKVCLDVNESGSDTSSVVALKPIVISNSIDVRHKFFRADHPFYFAIRNRDATYFMGHVTKF